MKCPNLSNSVVRREFLELVDSVGENMAYTIFAENGGNPIDKAPNGEPSKLFNDILGLPGIKGNRKKAILLKGNIFRPSFKEWFGESITVDENGEPSIVIVEGLPVYSKQLSEDETRNDFKSAYRNGGFDSKTINIYTKEATHPFFIDHNYFFNRLFNEGVIQYAPTKKATIQTYKLLNQAFIDGNLVDVTEEKLELIDMINDEFIKYSKTPLIEYSQEGVSINLKAISTLRKSQDYAKKFTSSVNDDATNILNQLQAQFNIPYIVVEDRTADWKGRFIDGTVVINSASFTEDTAFHEYAHPFIEIIEQQNPALYEQLEIQVATTSEGKAEMKRINSLPLYRDSTVKEQTKEVIVSLLGKYAKDNNFTTDKDLKYYLKLLYTRILEHLKDALTFENNSNNSVDVSKIPSTVTLREISTLFNTSLKFDLSEVKGDFYQAVDTTLDQEQLEALTKINNTLIESIKSTIEDLNLLITEESDTKSRDKAKKELQSLIEKVRTLDQRDIFFELAKKAHKDLSNLDKWLSDIDNFKEINPDTERNLILTKNYLLIYKDMNSNEFADTEELKKIVGEVNKFLKRIDRRRDEVQLEYLANYVAKTTSNPKYKNNVDFVKALLVETDDLGMGEAYLTDLGSTKHPLFHLIDKKYKNFRQLVKEEHEEVVIELGEVIDELVELSGGDPNNTYGFMLNEKEGKIVEKTGLPYYTLLDELEAKIKDTDGNNIQYHKSETLTEQEKVENIDLAKKKNSLTTFNKAEDFDDKTQTFVDGQNHKYSDEFKQQRDKFQVVDTKTRQWVINRTYAEAVFKLENPEGLNTLQIAGYELLVKEYQSFIHQYYSNPISYYRATTVKVGSTYEFDGNVEFVEDQRFPLDNNIEVTDLWNSNEYSAIHDLNTSSSRLQVVQKQFYDLFTKRMEISSGHLPKEVSQNMKGRMPAIMKHALTRFSQSESKFQFLKDSINSSFTTAEVYVNDRALDKDGKLRTGVPILYTNSLKNKVLLEKLEKQLLAIDEDTEKEAYDKVYRKVQAERNKLNPEDLSTNLGSSLLAYINMANNYKVMNEYESFVLLAKDQVEKTKYVSKDTSGNSQLTNTGKTAYKGESSLAEKRLSVWMSNIFYDSPEYNETKIGKIAQKAMNYTSARNLGLNIFSSLNNVTIGAVFQHIELLGGQYFAYSNYTKANKEFSKYLATGVFADMNQSFSNNKSYKDRRPQSKETAFARSYGVVDEQNEVSGNAVKGDSFLERLWDGDFIYVGIHMGEFANQMRTAMAIMMDETIVGENGETVSLWDAHTMDSKGRFVLKEGYVQSEEERYRVINKIKGVNQHIHGAYNKEDSVALQAHWLGRLVMHHKKWVPKFFHARFGERKYNDYIGVDMEGRYRTAGVLLKNVYNYVTKGEKILKISDWDATQRANMIKNAAEAAYIITFIALYHVTAAIAEGVDDEDETTKRMINWLHYQDSRWISELTVAIDPIEFYSSFKNPIASQNMLKEIGEVMLATFQLPYAYATGTTEELVYDRGFRKDESKWIKQTNDVFPFLNVYEKWHRMIEKKDNYRE